MAVFVDTGVFVAARNSRDRNHVRASQLMESALRGEQGTVYTSDYVVDESVTTALARTHDFRIALNTGRMVIQSQRIEKLFTGPDEFQAAWEKFQKLGRKPMSFTDCVTLAQMERHGIVRVMSFDSEFDGLKERIHRRALRAVRRAS